VVKHSNGLVRIYFFLVISLYSSCLIFSHSTYLVWQDYVPFFKYSGVSVEDLLALFVFLVFVSMLTPLRVTKVSDIFVWILLLFLYLPIFIITIGSKDVLSLYDSLTFLILLCSFSLIAVPSFVMNKKREDNETGNKKILINFFYILWILLFLFLFKKYSAVMSLRGLDDIYAQRELGKADSLVYGYAQVYFGYVISVGLVALGLFYKNGVAILIGLIGCLVLYAITAERTIFILPIFVYMVHKLIMSERQTSWFLIFIFVSCLYFLFIGEFGDYNKLTKDFGFYFLTRVVAIPGMFFTDYLNYFGEVGYTNFTHAKGFGLFFEASSALIHDPLYPELGRIIARDVYGINSNSNASFLATDGAAGFGLIGVLIVSVVLSIILCVINFLTKNWPLQLIVPVMAPMALTLTNGSIFTVMLSFGMLFWIAIFCFYKVKIRI
jgi:hypothetical protein